MVPFVGGPSVFSVGKMVFFSMDGTRAINPFVLVGHFAVE